MHKVAILMRYYNRNDYVFQAIESALNQTFKNKEIILIDDGSIIPLEDVLPPHLKSKVRILRIAHGGMGKALQQGIEHMDAEYFVCCDDDDLLHPQMLEKCMLKSFKTGADLVLTGFKYFSDTISPEQSHRTFLPHGRLELSALLGGYHLPVWNCVLVKKLLVDQVKGVDANILHCEDLDLWLRIAILNPKIAYEPSILSYVRGCTVHQYNQKELLYKEWRLKVIVKSQEYLPFELRKKLGFQSLLAFRYLITGWYQITYGAKPIGRKNLWEAVHINLLLLLPVLVLFCFSFLPSIFLKYLTYSFEWLFGRKRNAMYE